MIPLGSYEILVIVVVALAIIGPKDLPLALRTVFRVVRKAQAVTREFRRGLEDLAKDTGLDEVRKDLKSATSVAKGNFGGFGTDILGEDPIADIGAGTGSKSTGSKSTGSKPTGSKSTGSMPEPAGKDPAGGKSIGESVASASPTSKPETAGPAKADADG